MAHLITFLMSLSCVLGRLTAYLLPLHPAVHVYTNQSSPCHYLQIAINVFTTHTNVIYFPNARPCYYSHPDLMVMVSDCLLLDGDYRARLCRRPTKRKWV